MTQEAKLVSEIVTPLLEAKKREQAVKFCDSFTRHTLRLPLIDENGKVAADSQSKSAFLDNHLDREEVKAALEERPQSVMRYSESLGRWMIYYALPIRTANGNYVLRAAISTDQVRGIIDFSRLNMFLALLFGSELMLVLFIYIVRKIRHPLISLQQSVGEIAAGNLDCRIEIPENGAVRDLAIGVAEMTEQLKHRINEVTAERNERQLLFETMDEGVLLLDANNDAVRYNPAAAKLFNFAPVNGKFNLGCCQIPELLNLAMECMNNGEGFEREFALATPQGNLALFVKAHPLNRNGENYLFMTATDLTKLRKLESFRSDFVANVSHEIKTPLTGIVGAVEALEDTPTPDARQRLLEMLKLQSKRLNNLVQDILSLAALEKEQHNPGRHFDQLQLDDVAANAVNLCLMNAENSQIQLAAGELPPITIQGDSALLEQALVNLIENAIKYSCGTQITVTLEKHAKHAVLSVQDNGIGIPQEHQERIFERFYRVDKSRSRELGGTGLGLAIVKHIAQLHNGRAEVESKPGQGSTFKIILPL